MFGVDASLLQLGAVVALCGMIPAGAALAADHRRSGEVDIAGLVQQVQRERATLLLPDGRSVVVKAEACAAALVPGQPAQFIGHWDRRNRFEAESLQREAGAMPCDRDHRLAATAPIGAAAAIATAEAAGFAQVTAVEWEHGGWQLRAQDAQGRRVRLAVDGWSGQVSARPRGH